jgi:signal transduction histidine kinase
MSSLGAWLFVCLALVLVAGLAWRLGRLSHPGRLFDHARTDAQQAARPATALAERGAAAADAALTTSDAAKAAATAASASPAPASPQAADPDADPGLVSTLAHDLRAPVRVVEGFSRILKEDYGRQLDRVGNDHLDRVLAAAARMNGMIDAMLAMARLAQTPLQRQPVNLSQLAGFIVEDLKRGTAERSV